MELRNLRRLVQEYQACYHLEDHLAFYRELPTLDASIETAALARLPNGKRHNHQRRLSRSVLEEVRRNLLAAKEQVQNADGFDDILRIVRECSVPGFGELARYDAALRIGAHLGKLPTRVYLHAGTRKGAVALGLPVDREFLDIDQLPRPLGSLPAYQVEDFLCIYKDVLSRPHADEQLPSTSCLPRHGAVQAHDIEEQVSMGTKPHC